MLLTGYRPGAVDALGWTPARLAALNPALVTASLSAYGDTGPWAGRRGFDSLVQVATGLAHEARATARATAAAGDVDDHAPVSLPAQALDHLTGWFLVAGIAVALRRRATDGGSWHTSAVLARTARWLDDLGRVDGGLAIADERPADLPLDHLTGPLGRTTHVACPGAIGDVVPRWAGPPVPLGSHDAAWW